MEREKRTGKRSACARAKKGQCEAETMREMRRTVPSTPLSGETYSREASQRSSKVRTGKKRRTFKVFLRQTKVSQTQSSIVRRRLVLPVKLLVPFSNARVAFTVAMLEIDEAGSDFC